MKKWKVGILGAGSIAHRMAKTLLSMEDAEAYAVASRALDKSSAFAAQYGFSKAYGSYQELLNDPAVDLIYVAVPHALHADCCRMCIDAGKPVLCEKPFSADAATAKAVFDYAEAKRVFITEANWVWYMPMLNVIRELCNGGEIGEIRSMSSAIGWRNFDSPRIEDPAMAGGVLLDMGVYPLTLARVVFGDAIERIDTSVQMGGKGVDLQETITLHYAGNRMATMFITAYTPAERTATLYGDKGYAVIHDVNNYQSIQIFDDENVLRRTVEQPHCSTGFEHEVEACFCALAAGKLECDALPHHVTLETLALCDRIRSKWGLKYPWESKE